jgi:hypothetical protein
MFEEKTKFRRCCSRFSFGGLPETIGVPLIDCAWEMMVNTLMDVKSSNSMTLYDNEISKAFE